MKRLNIVFFALSFFIMSIIFGCGQSVNQRNISDITDDSRGYVLYAFAKRTDVMIDFNKTDGLSSGTKLDVFRTKVTGMDEPVKLGEIVAQKVGDKMSKAKVSVITSSLKMERGDRVLPHPITIVTDDTWISHVSPEKGWKSEYSLPNQRDWSKCEVINRLTDKPAARQLISDTGAKSIWYPRVTSSSEDIYFRKVFQVNADVIYATLDIICGGRVNIYLNDTWIGEIKEPTKDELEYWPKIESFKVRSFLRKGKNVIAVQVFRDQRSIVPSGLLMALSVQTSFR
jgi:hypothetical protein